MTLRIIPLTAVVVMCVPVCGADVKAAAENVAATTERMQTVRELANGRNAAPSSMRPVDPVIQLSDTIVAAGKKVAAAKAVAARAAEGQQTMPQGGFVSVQPQVPGPAVDSGAAAPGTAAAADKLYYNALPATPSTASSAIKVIDSQRDIDYVSKVYRIKTKGIAAELASYVRRMVEKADGEVYVSVNQVDGLQLMTVIGPDYQFPSVDAMVERLDREGVTFYNDGMVTMVLPMQHRLASDLTLIASVVKSPDGTLCGDNKVNIAYYQDSPSYFAENAKILQQFDQPPQMVRIEAQIIEIEAGDDFNFGLALEQWKEALPDSVDLQMDFQQGGNAEGLINLRPSYNAQSVYLKGMHPKAVANMINYMVRTGNAKVLSRPTIVAINGEDATIESLETIDYKAYTVDNAQNQAYPLAKQTQQGEVGVILKIKPAIAQQSMTLEINAAVNSLVGWATSGEPIINRRTTTAKAVLQDNELFAVSGLRKDTIAKADERVPVLGSIPLIGYLFRHEVDTKKTTEILVLLTPSRVTPTTAILAREKELLEQTTSAINPPAKSATDTFVDRVLLNKK
jgi:type II secretory pathway component GspD/PulD (secretin)